MSAQLIAMTMEDYDEVLGLWNGVEGVGLSDADSRDGMQAYLARNPCLSFVARSAGELVGAVLCGHDGRRGYLHHLAVKPEYRRQGIGGALVDRCLDALREAGIRKCNIFLFESNESGRVFWQNHGWAERHDLAVLQKPTHGSLT